MNESASTPADTAGAPMAGLGALNPFLAAQVAAWEARRAADPGFHRRYVQSVITALRTPPSSAPTSTPTETARA